MTVNTVLIVGASRGIGLGFVQSLLQNPQVTTIIATYRNVETAKQLLDLRELWDNDWDAAAIQRLHCLPLDATDEGQIEALVTQIKPLVSHLDLVINCVGILHDGPLQPEKGLRQINGDQLLRYFQINSVVTPLLAKQLQPLLKHGDRSVLATLSAKVGSIGDNYSGGWYGYRASKAALNMFIKTIALEYKRRCPNTIVVALHPGTTITDLSAPFRSSCPPDKLYSVEQTVGRLLRVLAEVKPEHSGQFLNWDGQPLPW